MTHTTHITPTDRDVPEKLYISGLAFAPNALCIEGECALDGFWLYLPHLGWMRFELVERINQFPKCWKALEVRQGPCPEPDRSVVWQGVLWTRRAAIEAQQTISAYLADLARCSQSEPQSNREESAHAA
jgi:hypothetical protein